MPTSASQKRFDVVVFNYRRLDLFFSNFWKLGNFDRKRDRITVVSASPSASETELIERFESEHEFSVRYLTRENRGLEQLPRAQYFVGDVGAHEDNLSHAFVFQMQEHYLDTEHQTSLWTAEGKRWPKGDVVPKGVTFDLDRMGELAESLELKGFFCDFNNPCFIRVNGERFVAPCGGNFAIRSDAVEDEKVQQACRALIETCDDTYRWCVYAEFMWGLIFFEEGDRFYDLKRERLFERWEERDFYLAPDDFLALKRYYERPAWMRAVRRGLGRPKRAIASLRR
jgi:hypothetical protein